MERGEGVWGRGGGVLNFKVLFKVGLAPHNKFEKFEYINIIQELNLIPWRAYTDNVGDVCCVGGTIHLLRQQKSSPPRLRLGN